MRLAVAFVSLLALAAMLLSLACGDDDDGGAAEVEAAVQAAFDSWNAKDLDGLVAAFTDAGLISVFGDEGQGTVEDVKAELPPFMGEPPFTNPEFREITVDDDSATADVQVGFGIALNALRFTLVRQDGTWKIDREDNIAVEIPDGTETIEAETYEFAFNIDTDAPAAATEPVAIAIDNIGTQPHELAIIRVPADADVLALFQRPGGGEMEFVGQEGPLEPGESLNLVFTQALEPGRYVILCFLPDTSEGPRGTPHVFKGMLAEFTKS